MVVLAVVVVVSVILLAGVACGDVRASLEILLVVEVGVVAGVLPGAGALYPLPALAVVEPRNVNVRDAVGLAVDAVEPRHGWPDAPEYLRGVGGGDLAPTDGPLDELPGQDGLVGEDDAKVLVVDRPPHPVVVQPDVDGVERVLVADREVCGVDLAGLEVGLDGDRLPEVGQGAVRTRPNVEDRHSQLLEHPEDHVVDRARVESAGGIDVRRHGPDPLLVRRFHVSAELFRRLAKVGEVGLQLGTLLDPEERPELPVLLDHADHGLPVAVLGRRAVVPLEADVVEYDPFLGEIQLDLGEVREAPRSAGVTVNDEKVRVELDEPGDVERRAVTRRALTVGGEVGRLEEPGDVLGLRVGRVGRRLLRHVEVEGAPLDEVLAVRADQLVRAEPVVERRYGRVRERDDRRLLLRRGVHDAKVVRVGPLLGGGGGRGDGQEGQRRRRQPHRR
mmetsp:Transcript_21443/g.47653  ORF Transcript_21443/g.47653 Transcript_21443/m.47653 type:complete len:447 (-) Transcript_21443:296-1636(-)